MSGLKALLGAVIFWALGVAGAGATCLGIGCTCNVAAQPVPFGLYDPFAAAPNDSAGRIDVTCSVAVVAGLLISYNIALSKGGGPTYGGRRMIAGAYSLPYNLYTDASRSTIWGDGSAGTSTQSFSYLLNLFSRTDTFTPYGRVPAHQNVGVGAYTDSITVTITF